jgi:histidyl-tRNA synthetase
MGVECFGIADAIMDAELIEMTDQLWSKLGIREAVTLQLNSIGSTEARDAYRDALVKFLLSRKERLDPDSQARLERSPLRILDSKNEQTQAVLEDAPSLFDYLTNRDLEHFQVLTDALDQAGIHYQLNPQLVRGLDYYSRTVFEWVTTELGAQGSICGGGRYDGLAEHLGGRPTPGVGFALGMERVILLLEVLSVIPNGFTRQADIFLMPQQSDCEPAIRQLARTLRGMFPSLRVMTHIGGGSLKSQLKKADKSGARIGLIIGETELRNQQVVFKPLRGGEQETISYDALQKRMSEFKDA